MKIITILKDLLNEDDPLLFVLLLLDIMKPAKVLKGTDQGLGRPVPVSKTNV